MPYVPFFHTFGDYSNNVTNIKPSVPQQNILIYLSGYPKLKLIKSEKKFLEIIKHVNGSQHIYQ